MRCAGLRWTAGLLLVLVGSALGQDTKPAETKDAKAPEAKKTYLSPLARLTSAKTMYIKRAGGSDVAVNVIRDSVEGWARYKLVSESDQPDLIMEISAPDEGSGGITVSSSTNNNTVSGRPEESTKSSRQISSGGGPIRMIVYEPKTHVQLFMSSEVAKSAIKQKTREDNLVEAAQKLFLKFHDRVEPPPQ